MNSLSSGQITNLVANDASQVEFVLYFLHYLWVCWMNVHSSRIIATLSGRTLGIDSCHRLLLALRTLHLSHCCRIYVTTSSHPDCVRSSLCLSEVIRRPITPLTPSSRSIWRTRILQVTDERVKIMSEVIKSMRIVKMYCWESAFDKRIKNVRTWVTPDRLFVRSIPLIRREIVRCLFRLLLDCVQTVLSHTYIGLTFLMMYGVMWTLKMPIDTRFFAMASCMLGYMRLSIVDFFTYAVRNLVHYFAARTRLQVSCMMFVRSTTQ
jgi:hypothetical protein